MALTKLQLVQKLHTKTGIATTQPTTLTGLTGINADLVEWIEEAYEYIQNKQPFWNFLRTDFSEVTAASTQSYSLSDWGLTDLGRWNTQKYAVKLYSSVNDETYLEYVDWRFFTVNYLYGARRSQTDRPTTYSIKPDKSMIFWPTPNAVFTVSGEYWKRAQTFATEDSAPLFSDYHMLIVWRAMLDHSVDQGDDALYVRAQSEYDRLLGSLEYDELPKLRWGAPLA